MGFPSHRGKLVPMVNRAQGPALGQLGKLGLRACSGTRAIGLLSCWAIGLICHLGKLAQRKNGYDRRVIHVKGLEMLSLGIKMAEEFG